MPENKSLRADKFLWSVRIYKSRTLAAEACSKGRIIIKDLPVKASRLINEGDVINVRKTPVMYSYQVTGLPKSRVSASIVPEYIKNLTSEEELEKLKALDTFFVKRDRGSGRPTKKERRLITRLKKD